MPIRPSLGDCGRRARIPGPHAALSPSARGMALAKTSAVPAQVQDFHHRQFFTRPLHLAPGKQADCAWR